MRYRKRPVVIEAVHYDGTFPLAFLRDDERVRAGFAPNTLQIVTLEGTMTAQVGDWIIRGVKGELYPCKPDIFEATYEALSERSDGPEGARGVAGDGTVAALRKD